MIARTLVDGIDITLVRERYPVQRQLLAAYRVIPKGAGTGDLTDPRLAVAAGSALVLGSAIWDRSLRDWAGIDHTVDVDPAITTLARAILTFRRTDHHERGDRTRRCTAQTVLVC